MAEHRKPLRFFSLRFRLWSPLVVGTIVGGVLGAVSSPLIANGHIEAAWNALGYPFVGAILGAMAGGITSLSFAGDQGQEKNSKIK